MSGLWPCFGYGIEGEAGAAALKRLMTYAIMHSHMGRTHAHTFTLIFMIVDHSC